MTLNIKNQNVELKLKMRAYLLYEELSGKAFQPKTLMEILIFFYSIILANSPDIELTFEELLSLIDDDPTLLEKFNEWVLSAEVKNSQFHKEKKTSKKK